MFERKLFSERKRSTILLFLFFFIFLNRKRRKKEIDERRERKIGKGSFLGSLRRTLFSFLLQSRKRKRLNKVQMARFRQMVRLRSTRARLRALRGLFQARPRIQGINKNRIGQTPLMPEL